ncbi:MAG: beta-hexosaminidase [Ruminiclostridium sp.]|nr:beta-hexosaminidase [Ruminiclostridium sp.]
MKKKTSALLAVIFALCGITGCGNGQPAAQTTGTSSGTSASGNAATTTAAETTASSETVTAASESTEATDTNAPEQEKSVTEQAEEILAGMTLEQKIAQMISVSFHYWTDITESDGSADTSQVTTVLNEKQKAFLTKYDIGGITLFAKNTVGTEQTARLTAEIQEAALESEQGIPLLICADQEGGYITRLKTGTTTCGNMALGATGDTQAAYDNAAIIGSELYALGINTDYAPVLDVNNNPANPVINVRSFSSDPELVAKLGTAYIEGLESEGVISTVKHFPGHGDTDTDSHTGFPKIDKPLDEIRELELIPYAATVDKADMVMTAHIQFPQIETETYTSVESGEEVYLPATLSKTIITGILRGELGFDGVVITDAMLMDAIKVNFDPLDAAILAINADVDMILEPMYIVDDASIEELDRYISAIADAVNDGRIPLSQIDDSVMRILSLKIEKGLFDERGNIDDAVSNAKKIVGSQENHDKELEIAEKAITLIKNDDDTLPVKLNENDTVAYFYPYEGEENTIEFALDRLKAVGIVPTSVTADCHCVTEKNAAGFEDVISNSAVVILAVETYRQANMDAANEKGWQAVFADEMIDTAHRLGKKVVLLSMQLPYDAARYTKADAILCAYCGDDMPVIPTEYDGETATYGVNYPAALITVFGGNSPTGKLPVDIPALDENTMYTDTILYPIGYGETY